VADCGNVPDGNRDGVLRSGNHEGRVRQINLKGTFSRFRRLEFVRKFMPTTYGGDVA